MIVELYDHEDDLMRAFDEVKEVTKYASNAYTIEFTNEDKEEVVVEEVKKVVTKPGAVSL